MRNMIWVMCLFGLLAAVVLGTSACMTGLDEPLESDTDPHGEDDDDSWKLDGAWAEVGKAWDGIVFDNQKRTFELNCEDEVYVQDGNTDERILVAFTSAKHGIFEIDQDKPGEITQGLESVTYSFEDDELTLEVTWESESVKIVFFRVQLGASCTEGDDDEEEEEGEEDEDSDGECLSRHFDGHFICEEITDEKMCAYVVDLCTANDSLDTCCRWDAEQGNCGANAHDLPCDDIEDQDICDVISPECYFKTAR